MVTAEIIDLEDIDEPTRLKSCTLDQAEIAL